MVKSILEDVVKSAVKGRKTFSSKIDAGVLPSFYLCDYKSLGVIFCYLSILL